MARKGTKIAKRDKYEVWVIPAEAGGWRATMFKRKSDNTILSLKDAWRKTKAEAMKIARGYKKYL